MRKLATLAALALTAACGRGEAPAPPKLSDIEREGQLEAELLAVEAAIEPLRSQGPTPEDTEAFVALEKDVEHAAVYGGVIVWTAVAEPVVRSFVAAVAKDTGAELVPTLHPATPTALPLSLEVKPASKTWAVARRIVDESGSRPTALLKQVDPAGRIEAYLALDPLPISPSPEPVAPKAVGEVPPTPRGRELAKKLEEANKLHAQLVFASRRAASMRQRVGDYRRRLELYGEIADLRERQRALAAALEGVTAKQVNFGDASAELRYDADAAASKAARDPRWKKAGLAATAEGDGVVVTFAGEPPQLPPYAERKQRAAEETARKAGVAPTPAPSGPARPVAKGLKPGAR